MSAVDMTSFNKAFAELMATQSESMKILLFTTPFPPTSTTTTTPLQVPYLPLTTQDFAIATIVATDVLTNRQCVSPSGHLVDRFIADCERTSGRVYDRLFRRELQYLLPVTGVDGLWLDVMKGVVRKRMCIDGVRDRNEWACGTMECSREEGGVVYGAVDPGKEYDSGDDDDEMSDDSSENGEDDDESMDINEGSFRGRYHWVEEVIEENEFSDSGYESMVSDDGNDDDEDADDEMSDGDDEMDDAEVMIMDEDDLVEMFKVEMMKEEEYEIDGVPAMWRLPIWA